MAQDNTDYYNQAIDAVQSGQLDKAISLIEEALTEDPNDSGAWQMYVKLLTVTGRSEDAAKAKAKLLAAGISEVEKRTIEASEALAAGDTQRAISAYRMAVEAEPENADVYSSLGLVLFQSGEQDEAIVAGKKAVELDPADAKSNYVLGHMLRLMGRKDEALVALTKSVEAEGDFMPALYEQGMLLADNGQLEKALGNFQKFSAAHPTDENARTAIETIKKELGRTDTY